MEKIVNNLVGKITDQAITIHDLRRDLNDRGNEIKKGAELGLVFMEESRKEIDSLKSEMRTKKGQVDHLIHQNHGKDYLLNDIEQILTKDKNYQDLVLRIRKLALL